jgi:hypothetical protein
MALDLFSEAVEIILGTARLSAVPLGLLEVHSIEAHRIGHYRPFQLATGRRFQLEKEVLAFDSNVEKTLR